MRRLAILLCLLPGMAHAQLAGSSFFGSGLGSDTLDGAAPYGNPVADNRVYIHGWFDQLEGRIGDGSYLRWDGQGWIGDDENRLWIKSEGRYNPDDRGRMTDGDHEFLYDRPISPYFDLQAGMRVDLDSGPTRSWAALGIQGLAIGFWNVEATLYASDGGHYALKTNTSYDLYLTQRLVLQPQLETNWYTAEDRGRGIGAGYRTSIAACGCATMSRGSSRRMWVSRTSAASAALRAWFGKAAARSPIRGSWSESGHGSERGDLAGGPWLLARTDAMMASHRRSTG